MPQFKRAQTATGKSTTCAHMHIRRPNVYQRDLM